MLVLGKFEVVLDLVARVYLMKPPLDSDHAVRVRHRKPLQSDSVVQREDCCIGANAERQRKDDKQGESGIAQEIARAVAKVLQKLLEPNKGAGFAVLFFGLINAPKHPPGSGPGFFAIHVLLHESFLEKRQVVLYRFIEIVLTATAIHQRRQPDKERSRLGPHRLVLAFEL